MLNASKIKQAVDIACHPQRAYAFHYNLGSITHKRLLSIETDLDLHEIHEVKGLYVHTNHLVLDRLHNQPQDQTYVQSSSMTRYKVLTAWQKTKQAELTRLTVNDLTDALASHEGRPYSPCRHPTQKVSGKTLACARIDIRQGSWNLLEDNPCLGKERAMVWPSEKETS